LLLLLFVVACSAPEKQDKGAIKSIQISPSSLVVADIGASYQLSLRGQFSNGEEIDSLNGVVWSSSNNALVTVDNSGLVTVLGKGQVSIVAEYLNVKDTIVIDVVEVSSISMSPTKLRVTALNQPFSLNVVAKASDGRLITGFNGAQWASTDPNVVSVDDFGVLTSRATGTASVTATYKNNSVTSNIEVDESGDIVDGAAQYEDKLYSAAGFTGYDYKAIRFASVELLDANGDVFLTTQTDRNGAYSFGNIIPDRFSIRLLAQVMSAPAAGFSIKDMQGGIYSYLKSSNENTLNYVFSLGRTLPGAGVFNMLDVAILSAEYVNQVLGLELSDLDIYWEKNYGLGSTYYCAGYDQFSCYNDKGIYVISDPRFGAVDTDEFDDDVIMHEFGHYLKTTYSVDDSKGGGHTITQNDSDLRLSWSEGWGIFFPAAVKNWLQSQNPGLMSYPGGARYYIDTIGSEAALSHNIAFGEMGDGFYYASSEAAVARILWNILQEFGMPKIWDVLVNYFPLSGKPTSLPVFWDGLLASDLYSPNDLSLLESIFADRAVLYQADSSELDDTLSSASYQAVNAIPNVTNTLYSDELVSDIDYISFDAEAGQSYTVSTTELYNGIDTLIQLYDPRGTLLAKNDDAVPDSYKLYDSVLGVTRVRNNTTAMASQIKFVAALSGRYVVAVTYANKQDPIYDFLGHYGSYKLLINAQ